MSLDMTVMLCIGGSQALMDRVLSQIPHLSKALVFYFDLIPCDFVYISRHRALFHHSDHLLPNVCTCFEFIPWLFCLYSIFLSFFVLSHTLVSCIPRFADCSSMFWSCLCWWLWIFLCCCCLLVLCCLTGIMTTIVDFHKPHAHFIHLINFFKQEELWHKMRTLQRFIHHVVHTKEKIPHPQRTSVKLNWFSWLKFPVF